jgi:DNA helicase IV
VRASPALATALGTLWPSLSAAALVRALLTNRATLAAAADGVLTTAERAALRRKPAPTEALEVRTDTRPPPAWELRRHGARRAAVKRREPWTAADVALLDEAAFLITGEITTYGHVIVDEAQDLSPMQLRMVARRAPAGSVTVLGDLAQASSPWSPPRWDAVVEHLATPAGWRLAELRLGYRSPGDVIELASRLLPAAAPGVAATEPVRTAAGGVRFAAAENLTAAVVDHSRHLGLRHASVAVIAPTSRLDELVAGLAAAGSDVARAEDGLGHAVTVVGPAAVKGLEFDAVVVADPAGIVASVPDRGRGLRLLYVALTRPTQALAVLHCGDFPAELSS